MQEVKNKVEALLFSSARSMSVEEISNLVKVNAEEIKKALGELKEKYMDNKATELIQEGEHWKMAVRSEYVPLVSSIVTQTELSKSLMETLAVIAFKYPIKQSDLIKARTNKAYEHLKLLEEQGFITRQRYGRTRLIKLASKFFDYFDLPRDKLKEKFKDFGNLAKAIEDKEEIIEKMKKEKVGNEEEEKEKTEVVKEPEVDLVDDKGEKVKLEVVNEPEVYEEEEQKLEVIEDKEKVEGLEVVDVPEKIVEEQKVEEKKNSDEEIPGSLEEEQDLMEELQEKKIKTEMEKEVDKKVDALLHPPKEDKEEDSEEEGTGLLDSEEENK